MQELARVAGGVNRRLGGDNLATPPAASPQLHLKRRASVVSPLRADRVGWEGQELGCGRVGGVLPRRGEPPRRHRLPARLGQVHIGPVAAAAVVAKTRRRRRT